MALQIDQSSPQAVAARFKAALNEKAWRRAFAFMVPELQANMLGGLFLGAGFSTDGDPVASEKLVELMRKHGLRRDETLDPETADLVAIIRDVVTWSDRYLPDDKKLDLAGDALQSDYSDFRIVGDSAYAINTCKDRKSETRFRRIDGLWFLI